MHSLWPRQREIICAKTSIALKPRIFSPANLFLSTVASYLPHKESKTLFLNLYNYALHIKIKQQWWRIFKRLHVHSLCKSFVYTSSNGYNCYCIATLSPYCMLSHCRLCIWPCRVINCISITQTCILATSIKFEMP